jgi:hypothetical protein
MVKFAHLLVLSVLIVSLAGSGCIGNDSSKGKEATTSSKEANIGHSVQADDLGVGLTQAELKELDDDMIELQNVLEDSSLGEEIDMQDMGNGKEVKT